MGLWEDIQPWVDKETGLIQAGDFGRDNLPLMTAYLIRDLEKEDHRALKELQEPILKFEALTKVVPGLYKKLPDSWDDVTEDNITGMAYLLSFAAKDILAYWREHCGVFTIKGSSRPRDWMGIKIGLKQFLKGQSSESLNLLDKVLFNLSVWFTVKTTKGASDALKLSLKVDALMHECPWAHDYFYKNLKLSELYLDYFKANHPLTIHAIRRGE